MSRGGAPREPESEGKPPKGARGGGGAAEGGGHAEGAGARCIARRVAMRRSEGAPR